MEKLIREVQEGMPCARRVRLMCEGTTFETWEPLQNAGIDPEEWAKEAENLMQALLGELPKRRVQLMFVAEDTVGATIATVPRTVTGQNASAQDLGTQNGAKALADAIASVAKTTDFVGEMARKMLEYQSGVIEKQNTTLFEYHELFMTIKKLELEESEGKSAVAQIMGEQVKEALPLLMKLVNHWAEQPKPAKVAAVVEAVKTVATNGAS
jgi:hypothetical protein